MHRYLALVFALLIPLLSLSSQAQTEPVAAIESPLSTPVTLKAELAMLQQAIDTDIRKLKNAKGELKTIVEYRI